MNLMRKAIALFILLLLYLAINSYAFNCVAHSWRLDEAPKAFFYGFEKPRVVTSLRNVTTLGFSKP